MRWVGKRLPDFFRRVAQFFDEVRKGEKWTLIPAPRWRDRCVLLTIGHP